MRDAILAKLHEHLREGVCREADVVYLLVEIGKYLERRSDDGGVYPLTQSFPLLRFYRNWVAHSWIRKTDPYASPARQIEAALDVWLRAGSPTKAIAMIEAAISMEPLRDEVRAFLGTASIDLSLTDDQGLWKSCLHLLVGVLSDVPLVFEGFALLRTFQFIETPATESTVAKWLVEADGGQTLTGGVPWT